MGCQLKSISQNAHDDGHAYNTDRSEAIIQVGFSSMAMFTVLQTTDHCWNILLPRYVLLKPVRW